MRDARPGVDAGDGLCWGRLASPSGSLSSCSLIRALIAEYSEDLSVKGEIMKLDVNKMRKGSQREWGGEGKGLFGLPATRLKRIAQNTSGFGESWLLREQGN